MLEGEEKNIFNFISSDACFISLINSALSSLTTFDLPEMFAQHNHNQKTSFEYAKVDFFLISFAFSHADGLEC